MKRTETTHARRNSTEALCGAYAITIGTQVIYGSGLTFARKRPTCVACCAVLDAQPAWGRIHEHERNGHTSLCPDGTNCKRRR